MKIAVRTLDNKDAGQIELDDAIFAVPVRVDVLHQMVSYQLNKRRAGTHKTKGVSEVSGTGKKPWKQKGTGRARFGNLRAPQFKGGATIFGPVVRSHADLRRVLHSGQAAIWLPMDWLRDEPGPGTDWDNTSDSIAPSLSSV